MWPDRVSNPGPPTYESSALPIALRGPACRLHVIKYNLFFMTKYMIRFTGQAIFMYEWALVLFVIICISICAGQASEYIYVPV